MAIRRNSTAFLDLARGFQRHRPSLLSPQVAAAASTTMNVTPVKWPIVVALLRPWSTATVQRKNRAMAPTARIFSRITTPRNSPLILPDRLLFRSDSESRWDFRGNGSALNWRIPADGRRRRNRIRGTRARAALDTSENQRRSRIAGTCRKPSRDPILCGARIYTSRKVRRLAGGCGSRDPFYEE